MSPRPQPRSRIGHHQLAAIASELSARDLEILEKLGELRFLQTSQIRRLSFHDQDTVQSAERVCRRVLKRLHEIGLIARLDRRIGGLRSGSSGHVHVLSPLGHRLIGSRQRRRQFEPGLRHLTHSLAISELVVSLTDHERTGSVEILELEPEPKCWRKFTSTLGRIALKPDLAVRVANANYELSWFIEVDCGTESGTTIINKCETYLDYRRTGNEQGESGVFPRVLWITPSSERAERIETAIAAEALPGDLFVTATKAEALAAITDFSGP